MPNPLALIAEITHRCPLHCVYCSNPLQLTSRKEELETAEWLRIFSEAAALGVLHLHLTGGEPLARPDLAELITGARQSRLYTNLITSGIGLSRERLAQLVEVGLDHIQLSFQDSTEGHANWIAGARAHAHKVELAGWIREHQSDTGNLDQLRAHGRLARVVCQLVEDELPDQLALGLAPSLRECFKASNLLFVELGADVVHAVHGSLGGSRRHIFVVQCCHR